MYGPPRPTASGLVKKKIGACIIFIWPTAPHCLLPAEKNQGHVFESIICPLVPYIASVHIQYFSYTIIFIWPTTPHCLWPSKEKKLGACIIFIWPTAPHCLWPSKEKIGACFIFIWPTAPHCLWPSEKKIGACLIF